MLVRDEIKDYSAVFYYGVKRELCSAIGDET